MFEIVASTAFLLFTRFIGYSHLYHIMFYVPVASVKVEHAQALLLSENPAHHVRPRGAKPADGPAPPKPTARKQFAYIIRI